jgi:hypothetical protein
MVGQAHKGKGAIISMHIFQQVIDLHNATYKTSETRK